MKLTLTFPIATFAVAAMCAAASTTPVPANGAASDPAHAFIDRHCAGCHDAVEKEGGLDLTALTFDWNDAASFATWVKVHDRMRDAEMPPKKKARPPAGESAALLAWLDGMLASANAAQQAREGRTPARRLNRDEYQNTLRDLLGVAVDYRLLLPEDGRAHGFDKVGSALHVSAEHLQAYLAAASAAMDEAVVTGPAPQTIQKHFLQRFQYLGGDTPGGRRFKKNAANTFHDAPDALVRFGDFVDPIVSSPANFTVKIAGTYRFRVHARAWQSDQPVKARIKAGSPKDDSSGGSARVVGYHEFTPAGNTVEVAVSLRPGETLRVAPVGIAGFGRDEESGRVSFRKLGTTASLYQGPGLAMEWVDVEGPLLPAWPPQSHQRIFGPLDFAQATPADAERVLRGFLPRAFRRPIGDEEVRHYLRIHEMATAEAGFSAGIKIALQAALCSPYFLYLHAPAGPLDDYALAARLSYFLWSSAPDDELAGLAAEGGLRQPTVLRQQVERMLRDAKAHAFSESFTAQWLDLRNILATTPDIRLYPEFDELLEWSMVKETRLFFDEVLAHDLSVTSFVQSDFAMLNDRLATHYGIPNIEGVAFRKVALPADSVRGGVLTQASVLKVTADGTTTSPIKRGAWVMDRIVGRPPPPPPAGISAVEPDIRGAKSIREQLAQHRTDQTCNACHAKIDPPGFALESFDVIGGARDRYRGAGPQQDSIDLTLPLTFLLENHGPHRQNVGLGATVDASGEMPDGRPFRDFPDFRQQLLADKDQLARALAAHLVTYATGAAPHYADRAVIEQILARARPRDFGFRTLIHEIVQSPIFLRQ